MCVCATRTPVPQEAMKVLEPLEAESHPKWVLGIKLRSSTKAVKLLTAEPSLSP